MVRCLGLNWFQVVLTQEVAPPPAVLPLSKEPYRFVEAGQRAGVARRQTELKRAVVGMPLIRHSSLMKA